MGVWGCWLISLLPTASTPLELGWLVSWEDSLCCSGLSSQPVFQKDKIHVCVFGIRTDLGLNPELILAPGKATFSLQAALSLKRLGTACGPKRTWKDTKIYICVAFLSFEYLNVSMDFYLFFKFIYFKWRLTTLQYCSGFCHTLIWISHGFTCVPHPKPPPTTVPIPSLWVIPEHQPWAPGLMHQTWTGNLFHIW